MRLLLTLSGLVSIGVASIAAADAPKPAPTAPTTASDLAAEEAVVKSALAADKNPIKELRRLPWLRLSAFGITRNDDAAHYAVVVDGKAHLSTGKHADKRVTCILKAERAHERRVLTAADVVFLVHAFGTAPPTIQAALDHQTTGRGTIAGHDPTLTWTGAGAAAKANLVVWAPRPTARRGGAEPTPMLHLYKATLTISPSYALKWSVVSVDEPDPGTP